MRIIVLASASRTGGALTVFNQFLACLPQYIGDDTYYIFKDGEINTPNINGVQYIEDSNHSSIHRIIFDKFGLRKWCKKNRIKPDLVISFQNTGVNIHCRQIVYYHQSLPIYKEKWNPFKRNERTLFFYTFIYPIYVRYSFHKNTDIVVQTKSLRGLFAKRYKFDFERTHAIFPDINVINIGDVEEKIIDENYYHFIYPSNSAKYKRHDTLVKAMNQLKLNVGEKISQIRIYFTFNQEQNLPLAKLISRYGLEKNFVFIGKVPYSELLTYYKSADCLLFPSNIETIGLPLLEAASFGLPIISTNSPFAKDVLSDYSGVTYIDSFDANAWATEIQQHLGKKKKYTPFSLPQSSWPQFFKLIHNTVG